MSDEGWSIITSRMPHGRGYYREHYFDSNGKSLCGAHYRLTLSKNFSEIRVDWYLEPKTCNTCFRKLAKLASKKFENGWAKLAKKPKNLAYGIHYFLNGMSLCQGIIQHTQPQPLKASDEEKKCIFCSRELKRIEEEHY